MQKSCTTTALAILLICASVSAVRAREQPAADQLPTESTSNESPAPPRYLFDVMTPDRDRGSARPAEPANPPEPAGAAAGAATGTPEPVGKAVSGAPLSEAPKDESSGRPASADKPDRPRGFFDVFGGSATVADSTVTGSIQEGCFLFWCNPASYLASRDVHFARSSVVGFRIGGWSRIYPHVGAAADISYSRTTAPGVRIWYLPVSFVLMARLPLIATASMPEGRVQLYGGLMLSDVIGYINVDLTPDLPHHVGGSTDGFNFGSGALLGIAVHFSSVAFFAEHRVLNAGLDYSSDSDFTGASQSAGVDVSSKQTVFGISIKY